MSDWLEQTRSGQRFGFGANWKRFLAILDETRIEQAVVSLKKALEVEDLRGRSFLDVGSGSGLFSLAARRLGARVVSFDFDPQSVACTEELRRRFFVDDPDWTVARGSVLDADFVNRLGRFDIVYSWGVLHHTGDMWSALEQASALVAPAGRIFLALYNDQGGASRRWLAVKQGYNSLPKSLRGLFAFVALAPGEFRLLLVYLLRGDLGSYFRSITDYAQQSERGMSWWHDKVDWVGGLPFQVAKPEEVFGFFKGKGFQLYSLTTCGGGHGCNQYGFVRQDQG